MRKIHYLTLDSSLLKTVTLVGSTFRIPSLYHNYNYRLLILYIMCVEPHSSVWLGIGPRNLVPSRVRPGSVPVFLGRDQSLRMMNSDGQIRSSTISPSYNPPLPLTPSIINWSSSSIVSTTVTHIMWCYCPAPTRLIIMLIVCLRFHSILSTFLPHRIEPPLAV